MSYTMGLDLPRETRHEEVWSRATRMVPDFVGFRCDSDGIFYMAVNTPTGATEVTLDMGSNPPAKVHFVLPWDHRYQDAKYHIYGV